MIFVATYADDDAGAGADDDNEDHYNYVAVGPRASTGGIGAMNAP